MERSASSKTRTCNARFVAEWFIQLAYRCAKVKRIELLSLVLETSVIPLHQTLKSPCGQTRTDNSQIMILLLFRWVTQEKRRGRELNPHILSECRFSRPVLCQLSHHANVMKLLARKRVTIPKRSQQDLNLYILAEWRFSKPLLYLLSHVSKARIDGIEPPFPESRSGALTTCTISPSYIKIRLPQYCITIALCRFVQY